jgi:hypothetical protein
VKISVLSRRGLVGFYDVRGLELSEVLRGQDFDSAARTGNEPILRVRALTADIYDLPIRNT